MAPQESKKTDNFKPVVLSEFQAAVDIQACIDVSHAAVKSDLRALGNPINGSEH
jgi:hypothetical protein